MDDNDSRRIWRRGETIAAKGIYREGVRSSKSHFVKASGLRWMSIMWWMYIPFAQRVVGVAVLDSIGPFGALRCGARTSTQEDYCLGTANGAASEDDQVDP